MRMAGFAAVLFASVCSAGDVVHPVHAGSQVILGGSANMALVDLNAAGDDEGGDTFVVDIDADTVGVTKHAKYRITYFASFRDRIGSETSKTNLYVQVMRGDPTDIENAVLVSRDVTPCDGQQYPKAGRSDVIRLLPGETIFLCVWYGGMEPVSARLHPANGSQAKLIVELVKEIPAE